MGGLMKKRNKKPIKQCEFCQDEFEQKRDWQKFCSPQCRHQSWEEKNPRIKLQK